MPQTRVPGVEVEMEMVVDQVSRAQLLKSVTIVFGRIAVIVSLKKKCPWTESTISWAQVTPLLCDAVDDSTLYTGTRERSRPVF